jgi:xanthine dehydrogenase accessory factor
VSRASAAYRGGVGRPVALIKGAGDLATGVALRLASSGFAVAMTELAAPTVVRRAVAFAEAVYVGRTEVEGVEALKVEDAGEIRPLLERGVIPVIVDPEAAARRELRPDLFVDAVVAKRNTGTRIDHAPAVVALGPGFCAGRDVHAVIETKRGHNLGRVIWDGRAVADTGVPGAIGGYGKERLLRSPVDGVFHAVHGIGDRVDRNEVVGTVGGVPVRSQLDGVLHGLLRSGLEVTAGFKLGDVDPRGNREQCFTVSDKALAIAGGVLEAACRLLGGVRFGPGLGSGFEGGRE